MEDGGCRVKGGGRRVEGERWRVEGGEWRVESGEWRVKGGVWRVESERWRVVDGGWRMEGLPHKASILLVHSGRLTEKMAARACDPKRETIRVGNRQRQRPRPARSRAEVRFQPETLQTMLLGDTHLRGECFQLSCREWTVEPVLCTQND